MTDPPAVPPVLRSTAFLFLALGGLGAWYTIVLVRQGVFLPSPGLLGFPICFGLLRLSNAMRYLALIVLCVLLLFLPFYGWAFFQNAGARQAMFVLIVLMWLVSAWQLRVLLRPDIATLFHPNR